MKKITIIILILLMSFMLFSCSAADYKLAQKLYTEGDYEQAAVFFETAAKYKNSEDMLHLCKYYLAKMAIDKEAWDDAANYLIGIEFQDSEELLKECYMHTNQDFAFLNEIEKLVKFRLHQADSQGIDAQALATTEYECVKKYDLGQFYDIELKQIATNLSASYKLIYDSYQNVSLSVAQANNYEAQAKLCQAFKTLYEKYDFLKDDSDFVKMYVESIKTAETMAKASVLIKNDVDEQLKYLSNTGTPWYKEDNNIYFTATNNTQYTYSLEMHVTYNDQDGTGYYTDSQSAKLAPGESHTYRFTINSISIFSSVSTDYTYKDIYGE